MKKETLKLLLKEIVKMLKKESMFPKEFDRHSLGSCMAAAEFATKYFLTKNIKDFKVVEGWVSLSPDIDDDDSQWQTHTWIEFGNGRTFDPTRKQWRHWGYDPDGVTIKKIKKKYTPEEYLEVCEWEPSDWQKFKKPITEGTREEEFRKAKELQVKQVLSQLNDDNVVVTVQRSDELPAAAYVQVDAFANNQNLFSSNPEDLNQWGLKMPNTQQLLTLPQGRYKLSQAKQMLGQLSENMTYDQLLKLTASTPRSPDDNTNRLDRAKNVRARSIPVSVEEGQEQWNFRYKSNPSVTNTPFEGQITFLKGDVERKDDAMELECKVDCGCPDYRYKFAYNNYKQGAGDIGPDTLNKCINRAPQHAYDIGEGLCKHLAALRGYLQTKISSTRKSNLFEAISEVAKQGPFNITYYD